MTRPQNQILNWPNIITLVRISVIPLIVIIYYLPFQQSHLIAACIFALASISDWLDGYLARYLKQTTKLGAFLDPVADKLTVSVVLVVIVGQPIFQSVTTPAGTMSIPAAFITMPAAVIVAREIIVSALREWMAEVGKRAKVAVSQLGKVKTAVQMISLVILLYCDVTTSAWLVLLGYVLLYVAAILTIWSMLAYLKAAWVQLMDA